MTRWKIVVEYNGQPFVGWQRQATGLSVQEVLEVAAAKMCGSTVVVHGAGRTDAGVHALAQVAHLDIEKRRSAKDVRDGINFHLRPHPVAVLSAEAVEDSFHARLSARERRYEYHIINRRGALALEIGRAWHVAPTLDAGAMHEAAQLLVGKHDFSSFRASECQAKSPIKTLDELTVRRQGEVIVITARARSFLHHQVRNMVGTLELVGQGRWSAARVKSALEAANRAKGGPTAPPDGLYLVGVGY